MNENLSPKVEAALVHLEYLEQILKLNQRYSELDLQNRDEVQKMEEVYLDLKTALNSIKLKVDTSNNSNRYRLDFQLVLRQWAKTPTKPQLVAIEAKIKNAVQKSLELVTLSTSVAITKLLVLQNFQTCGAWPMTNDTIDTPNPPRLYVKELVNKFHITWDDNNDSVDFFELCYDEGQHLSIPLNGKTYEIEIGFPKVVPGRLYTMKIRGINRGGEGKWSDSVVAQLTKPTPRKPNRPKIHMISPTTARLTFVPPRPSCETESPVTEWNIQYIVDGQDQSWVTLYDRDIVPGKRNQTCDTSLIPNQKYQFRVQAKNAEGASDYSEPASIKAVFKPSLGAPKIERIRVKFTIGSPKWLSSLILWGLLCTNESLEHVSCSVKAGEKKQTFYLEDLTPDKVYNIQVKAITAEGYSAISPVLTFKTTQRNAPPFPTLLMSLVLALLIMLMPLSFYYIIPFVI